MTSDQVKRIKEQVLFAKTITDEKQRAEAFELISQQRDEMLLDCFRKQSERIKNVVAQNEQFEADIHDIHDELNEIKKQLNSDTTLLKDKIESLEKPLNVIYNDFIKRKAERHGMVKLIKVLKIAGVTLGSLGSTGFILKLLEVF